MNVQSNRCSLIPVLLLGVLAAMAAGCGSDSTTSDQGPGDIANEVPDEPLEIIGDWVDDFGGTHVITSDTWTMGQSMSGVFHITHFHNDGNWLVAHNDPDNAFSPDLWSRFDWTHSGGELYNCQTVYDAATEADAMNATPADPADPATGGCQGFAWSKLTAQ